MKPPLYTFNANDLQGEEISMDIYKGKTLLIVNTASLCGFAPQLAGLEQLYRKYKDRNFVILGFPCNQFASQEPGDSESIHDTCFLKFGVSFPLFERIDVNGKKTHPIYKYLKKEIPGLFGKTIKWNYTKFLINAGGQPIKRYATMTKPEDIEKDIQNLLG